MRFLIDMPLPPSLTDLLAGHGHDAVHASAVGLDRASDTEIIRHAVENGQTIATADLDYPRLLALMGISAPSPILFRSGNWTEAEIMSRMGEVLGAIGDDQLPRTVLVVERQRVRRRRLPL
jgi:predicted nuclease of predicted toxin-antitoxin system